MTSDDQLSAYGRTGLRRFRGQRRFTPGWFALLTLILALSWQSFVTETHHHPHPASLAQSAVHFDSGRHHQDEQAPAHLPPAHCLICRATALAGAAVLPGPVAFDPPVLASFQPVSAAPLGGAAVQRSHRWQSRAPPQLQA